MRTQHGQGENPNPASEPIPFPGDPTIRDETKSGRERKFDLTFLPDSAEQVLEAIEHMSRRIDDLARELNCLGHFDDDDDGPKAA
ncbi:MAG: hypothetical protein SYC29_16140 [Planctomycetota bacterium]|nr:hypothetical protein [Planctomycetota bacterium]